MAAPSLKPEPGIEYAEKDGQLVKLQCHWFRSAWNWFVVPPESMNEDRWIGPFMDRETALAVGACHMSWGEAF